MTGRLEWVLLLVGMLLLLTACTDGREQAGSELSTPTSLPRNHRDASTSNTPEASSPGTDETENVSKPEESVEPDLPPKDGLSIQYIGNSCFYIVFPDGTRIMSDPYGAKYASSFSPFPSLEADAVTLSHEHSDHTAGIYEVKGDPVLIYPERTNEAITVGEVEITGFSSKHVAEMGDNTIFVYRYGELKIVHMGETDSIASEEAINAVQNADVLLMYAGEYGGVKNSELIAFAQKQGVKLLVPQHYSMDPKSLWYGQPSMDMILEELPDGMIVTETKTLIVDKEAEPQWMILEPMLPE